VQLKHNRRTTIKCNTLTTLAGKKEVPVVSPSLSATITNSQRAEEIFITFDIGGRDISVRNVDKGPGTNSVSHCKDTGSSSHWRKRTGHEIDHLTSHIAQVKNEWK
jgi:hypothetical protein